MSSCRDCAYSMPMQQSRMIWCRLRGRACGYGGVCDDYAPAAEGLPADALDRAAAVPTREIARQVQEAMRARVTKGEVVAALRKQGMSYADIKEVMETAEAAVPGAWERALPGHERFVRQEVLRERRTGGGVLAWIALRVIARLWPR